MHCCFDELGVNGVYKVMKAARLSYKSLTADVAQSLAEFGLKADDLHAGRFTLVAGMNLFNVEMPAFIFRR